MPGVRDGQGLYTDLLLEGTEGVSIRAIREDVRDIGSAR